MVPELPDLFESERMEPEPPEPSEMVDERLLTSALARSSYYSQIDDLWHMESPEMDNAWGRKHQDGANYFEDADLSEDDDWTSNDPYGFTMN